MNEIYEIIEKVLSSENKPLTKEELQNLGILDENGEIAEAYKNILIKRDKNGN